MSLSVGEQRHRQARVVAEQHGPGDSGGSEPVAHLVQCGVQGTAAVAIQRQRELDGAVVAEIGQCHADQREARPRRRRRRGRRAGSSRRGSRTYVRIPGEGWQPCSTTPRATASASSSRPIRRPDRPRRRLTFAAKGYRTWGAGLRLPLPAVLDRRALMACAWLYGAPPEGRFWTRRPPGNLCRMAGV